jgi:hypothetical protein
MDAEPPEEVAFFRNEAAFASPNRIAFSKVILPIR